jgi:hypothetical protein
MTVLFDIGAYTAAVTDPWAEIMTLVQLFKPAIDKSLPILLCKAILAEITV